MTTDILTANPGLRGGGLVDQPLAFPVRRPRRPDRWLEAIYPMPNPLRSFEELLRAQHQDLPSLSELDLQIEIDAVKHRLRLEHNAQRVDWLYERLRQLAEWLRRWGGEPLPDPFPQLLTLGVCGCGKGSERSPTPPPARSSVIPVRGYGRAR